MIVTELDPSADRSLTQIAYITGTDNQRMLNAAILSASFKHHMPGLTLQICDFGMTENERCFWREVGGFLPVPEHLPVGLHPWKYKAALCEYMDLALYDAVVWLDADMVLLAPIHDQIVNLVQTMKSDHLAVAATPDVANETVAQVLNGFSNLGKDMGAFRQLLAKHEKNTSENYYNTGFLIICDYQFSNLWHKETMDQEDWVLFEQNTFNALVDGRQKNRLWELQTGIWNVHGNLLGEVEINDPSRSALILHATSPEQSHHIENEIQYPIGQKVLPGWFKLFVRDDLRDLQQKHLLQFLQDHLGALESCNMLADPYHA